jgi:hypothetical protein
LQTGAISTVTSNLPPQAIDTVRSNFQTGAITTVTLNLPHPT